MPRVASDEVWQGYYLALGHFMHAFSSMEDSLNGLVTSYLTFAVAGDYDSKYGAHYPVIQSAIGGMRLSTLKDSIQRLMRSTSVHKDIQAGVAEILGHLGAIQFLRNKIAHNSAYPLYVDGEWWFQTNDLNTIYEYQNHAIIYFTKEHLQTAASDLEVASGFIDRLLHPLVYSEAGDPEDEDQGRYGPWRYKPSTLKLEGPKYQPNPKRQPPRPPTAPK
jgi:hypothetical protein